MCDNCVAPVATGSFSLPLRRLNDGSSVGCWPRSLCTTANDRVQQTLPSNNLLLLLLFRLNDGSSVGCWPRSLCTTANDRVQQMLTSNNLLLLPLRRLNDGFFYGCWVIFGPVELLAVFTLVAVALGPLPALAGTACLLAIIPMQVWKCGQCGWCVREGWGGRWAEMSPALLMGQSMPHLVTLARIYPSTCPAPAASAGTSHHSTLRLQCR